MATSMTRAERIASQQAQLAGDKTAIQTAKATRAGELVQAPPSKTSSPPPLSSTESFILPGTQESVSRNKNMTDREWDIYKGRLTGTKDVSPVQAGIIESQKTQLNQMAEAPTQEARQQVYEANMEARKQKTYDSLVKNPNVSKEYTDLFQKKWDPIKQQMVGVTDAEWATVPDSKRSMELEAAKLKELGLSTPEGNEADLLIATYGDKLPSLIETGQVDPNNFTAKQLMELGFTEERLNELVSEGYLRPEMLAALRQSGGDYAQAQSVLDATPEPTNNAMNVLAEALNMKSNYKNQKLGVSDLFTQAGLSGYEVLAQSLSQRSQEMAQKTKSAQSLVAETGGAMADIYNKIAKNAESLREDFDKQMDRLLKIDESYRDNEFAMDKLAQQHENDKDLAEFKAGLEAKAKAAEANAYNKLDASDAGDVPVGDNAYSKSTLAKVFGVGSWASWCGVFASKVSTAGPVGNSWAEKKTHIQHRDNPTLGDKLLLPLQVKTDKGNAPGEYGHVAVVLGFDPETRMITVVESNRDGRMNRGAEQSKVTLGEYNIDDLNSDYGDNWGFMDGNLRKDFMDSLKEAPASITGGMAKVATGSPVEGMIDLIAAMPSFYDSTSNALKESSDMKWNEMSFLEKVFDLTGDPAVKNTDYAKAKNLLKLTEAEKAAYIKELQDEKAADKEEDADTGEATYDDVVQYVKDDFATGLYSLEIIKEKLAKEYGDAKAAQIIEDSGLVE